MNLSRFHEKKTKKLNALSLDLEVVRKGKAFLLRNYIEPNSCMFVECVKKVNDGSGNLRLSTIWANLAGHKLLGFFSPENRMRYLMQIVSLGGSV